MTTTVYQANMNAYVNQVRESVILLGVPLPEAIDEVSRGFSNSRNVSGAFLEEAEAAATEAVARARL